MKIRSGEAKDWRMGEWRPIEANETGLDDLVLAQF